MVELNWFQLHALAIWVESAILVGLRRLLNRIMGCMLPQIQLVEALELRSLSMSNLQIFQDLTILSKIFKSTLLYTLATDVNALVQCLSLLLGMKPLF